MNEGVEDGVLWFLANARACRSTVSSRRTVWARDDLHPGIYLHSRLCMRTFVWRIRLASVRVAKSAWGEIEVRFAHMRILKTIVC